MARAVLAFLVGSLLAGPVASAASGAYAWGRNSEGQLGSGDTVEHHVPWPVNLAETVTAVAAGTQHTLALTNQGEVYAWGSDSNGQLGNGSVTGNKTTPVLIFSSGVIAIDAWANRSFAVKSDGTLWGWGENGTGALGDGTKTNRNAPVQVLTNYSPQVALTGVKQVSTGLRHTLAVKTSGTVWAWGNNAVGQLGDGTTSESLVAFQVPGLSSINKVSAGEMHSMALTNGGMVLAWGSNSYGQVGVNTTTSYYADPWPVNGLSSGVYWICAGYSHGIAMKSNGTVWGWGRNNVGQLGDASWTDRRAPVQVSGLTGVTQISSHCVTRHDNRWT